MFLRGSNKIKPRLFSAEESLGRPLPGTGAPTNLREWAYWRPEAEEHGGDDFYRYMASPPPGREDFAVNPSTIDKAPLLFHHLLDLADSMESHGLAAHAAAPLAVCELVARLCLGPSDKASGSAGEEKGGASAAGTAAVVPSKAGKGDGGGGRGGGESGPAVEDNGKDAASRSPALALVCLRQSRLLLKLGPT